MDLAVIYSECAERFGAKAKLPRNKNACTPLYNSIFIYVDRIYLLHLNYQFVSCPKKSLINLQIS